MRNRHFLSPGDSEFIFGGHVGRDDDEKGCHENIFLEHQEFEFCELNFIQIKLRMTHDDYINLGLHVH